MAARRRMGRRAAVLVPHLYAPAGAILRWLRKEYPRAGVRGVGIGRRFRQKKGRFTREVVIKILLRLKREDVSHRERLPRRIEIVSRVLGKKLRVAVATDIESVARGAPTVHSIDAGTGGTLSAGAYARWNDGGVQRFGIVTAGHGLWQEASAPGHVPSANVALEGGPEALKVCCASHLTQDGLDVGLLELPPAPIATLKPLLKPIWSSARAAHAPFLLEHLGLLDDLLDVDTVFRYPVNRRAECESIAYYDSYPVEVAGWGLVRMKGAIESAGVIDTFKPGSSGSAIVTGSSPRVALGIQSITLDTPDFKRSISTSFASAIGWLREKVDPLLELVWHPDDLDGVPG